MAQPRDHLNLAFEAVLLLFGGQWTVEQNLDRDESIRPLLLRLVYDTLATVADRPENLVVVEGSAKELQVLRQPGFA